MLFVAYILYGVAWCGCKLGLFGKA